jgi:hypothetical protein
MASPEGINVMTTAIKGLNWALEGLVGFLRQATGELTVFDMFSNKKKIESGLTDRARENLRKAKENPNLLKGSTSTTNINFSGGVNFGAYSKNSKQAQTTFSNLLLNVSR